MNRYQPSEIESKWQNRWSKDKLYYTDLSKNKNKYYCLVELPYTSGDLHMGHWFTFTMGDVLARFKKMNGFNVIFPNGFDTFGLPAENAAIKNNMHPKDWTYANIDRMKKQFSFMGSSIDWTKTAITCDPEYYKWNQWIFLKMYEKDIAYRGKAISNWCPVDQTVLADENVEAGRCWRCGSIVEKKEVDQWFFRITSYADKLIWPDKTELNWPKYLRDAQNEWIGKSEGIEIDFKVIDLDFKISVFTKFPETIFGITYIVLAPEHKLVKKITKNKFLKKVSEYIKISQTKSDLERKETEKDKTGVFTGSYCINPVNNKKIPIWISDYVIATYGTGAVMGVPGSDERDYLFAKKNNLEVIRVISKNPNDNSPIQSDKDILTEGHLVNSGKFNGLKSPDPAKKEFIEWIEHNKWGVKKVNYHLHDWSISRSRYWGTPIPIIYCGKCGVVPVPENDLPVVLPDKVDYLPKGKDPLATAESWVKIKCPNCGEDAERETETMDGFVDNSWYFYRYLDHLNTGEIFNKEIISKWMPVDIYIGGAEHTYGHALFSRFFTKFFKDINLIKFDEYTLRRINHGVILGPDGSRMSKSKGNVVNPDDQVKSYGADSVRTYLVFLGPFDIVAPWNPNGINGIYHFLQRVWGLFYRVKGEENLTLEDLKMLNKTVNKVSLDVNDIKFNTAVASLMEWLNFLSKKPSLSKSEYKTFLTLLAPFAPHITEELWSKLGETYSIHQQSWPEVNQEYLEEEQIKLQIQINGKLREIILIHKDILNDIEVIEKKALQSVKIQKFVKNKLIKKTIHIPGKVLNFLV